VEDSNSTSGWNANSSHQPPAARIAEPPGVISGAGAQLPARHAVCEPYARGGLARGLRRISRTRRGHFSLASPGSTTCFVAFWTGRRGGRGGNVDLNALTAASEPAAPTFAGSRPSRQTSFVYVDHASSASAVNCALRFRGDFVQAARVGGRGLDARFAYLARSANRSCTSLTRRGEAPSTPLARTTFAALRLSFISFSASRARSAASFVACATLALFSRELSVAGQTSCVHRGSSCSLSFVGGRRGEAIGWLQIHGCPGTDPPERLFCPVGGFCCTAQNQL